MSEVIDIEECRRARGRPLATASQLQLAVLENSAEFERLASEWNELLAASDADGLFLTWEWLFTWWQQLGRGCKLSIVTIRRKGVLIALAPLVTRRASLIALPPVPVLQFLGSGVAGSDYLDVIIRRGDEREALALLADRLAGSARSISLTRMRPDGAGAALVASLSARGFHRVEGPVELCPFASLRGLSFESYLGSLSAEHRYAFRRKQKRIERNYRVRFERTHDEAERGHALETLFALHATRWNARGDAGAFSTPALRAFHHALSRTALERGWLRLWLLYLDDKPVGALYGFLYRRTFYFYQAGFDPAYARDSVGLVLLGVAVREAMLDGAEELDLLHGTERYKAHWASAQRELVRCELHAPGALGWLEREATALARTSRRLARLGLESARRVAGTGERVDHA